MQHASVEKYQNILHASCNEFGIASAAIVLLTSKDTRMPYCHSAHLTCEEQKLHAEPCSQLCVYVKTEMREMHSFQQKF
jgi:hypothetical protein